MDGNPDLTKRASGPIKWFLICIGLGIVFGNIILVFLSLFPLFFSLIGLLIRQPSEISVTREISDTSVHTGEKLEIIVTVKVEKGLGSITIHDELPNSFELIDGNNFRTLWKGIREKEFSLSYEVRCSKRGKYELSNLELETRHPVGMRENIQFMIDEEDVITVTPKIKQIRRLRGKKDIATFPYPESDIAKIGGKTTDFKEIREYQFGDPMKDINWKATAKMGSRKSKPLVNEYEVEGKKSIWIFLDASEYLKIGKTTRNVFEYTTKAANAVTRYFTDKNFLIGMYIYNDGEKMFYPDVGEKQYKRITEELINLETHNKNEGLDKAVESCKEFILSYNPLPVVITSVEPQSYNSFREGIKKLRAYIGGRRREKIPLMVLNVLPHTLNPTPKSRYKENAALLFQIDQKHEKLVQKVGGKFINWDPGKDKLMKVLLKEAKASET